MIIVGVGIDRQGFVAIGTKTEAEGLSSCEACCDNIGAAEFERDAGKRFRRRTLENRAVGGGEGAIVAGANEFIEVGTIEDGAGVVGAEAAEGEIDACSGVNQNAGIRLRGILENERASHRNFIRTCNHAWSLGARPEPLAEKGQPGGCRGKNAEADVFREAAARDLLRVLRVYGGAPERAESKSRRQF